VRGGEYVSKNAWLRQTREDVRSAIEYAEECGEDAADAAIQETLLALSKYPDCHPEFRHSVKNLRARIKEGKIE
jgi:hypothetical protein